MFDPARRRSIAETIRAELPDVVDVLLDERRGDAAVVAVLREHYEDLTRRFFPKAWHFRTGEQDSEHDFYEIPWRGLAHLRMLDLLDHEGQGFPDGNLHGAEVVSQPVALLRMLARGEECDVSEDFVEDMLRFLHQLNGTDEVELPSRHRVHGWMDRHPSGLDRDVITWRVTNKERIVGLLVERITAESEGRGGGAYHFPPGAGEAEKRTKVQEWWLQDRFHLRHAARTTDDVNRYLGGTVDERTMRVMRAAEAKGIPVFATPYFLSLVDVRPRDEQEHPGADEPIRSYLFYSEDLVEEFGAIVAWEKEDVVEPGQPNAAGWVLPSHNIHRRYPEVAIFIPDTMGRACGGLCSYCQRMYDFQRGRFNFDLDRLRPDRSWPERLADSMEYFRNDPTLEDILITGGDSFMSSVSSLRRILWAVLDMARAKRADNETRLPGERHAEMHRVRLGTKLPVYLPQRVTEELVELLREFRLEARELGITQCVVQTHISSAMEVTPYTARAVRRLLDAGWAVTNQEVFTVAASRRGHTAKLRKVLNDIGVLPYYTFTTKGYLENRELFTPNARSVQEQVEEKSIGRVDLRYHSSLRAFIPNAPTITSRIDAIRDADEVPFLATDRNMLNLPGVGKSNSFRMIGITADGRRILEFAFDRTRLHSPVIEKIGTMVVVESKSVAHYLRQLEAMGEDVDDYASIWGYSAGHVERRSPVFDPEPFEMATGRSAAEAPGSPD